MSSPDTKIDSSTAEATPFGTVEGSTPNALLDAEKVESVPPDDDFLRYVCADLTIQEEEEDPQDAMIDTAAAFAVVAVNDQLWDGLPQSLTYAFVPGKFSGNAIQHAKFAKYCSEWERYANVKFEHITDVDEALIRITFNPNEGSYSYIGKDCLKAKKTDERGRYLPTLNLGEVDGTQPRCTAREGGTILHECGHVLGLLHEHQNPACGGASAQNTEKVYFDYERRGWSRDRIEKQILKAINVKDTSNFSTVDRTSIMHYPSPKSLTGLPYDIPYNTKLSNLDKAYMVINYPRPKPHDEAPEWSLEHALTVAGVPTEVKQKMLELAEMCRESETGEIDPQDLRMAFSEHIKDARSKELEAQNNKAPVHTV
ncbi:hypothetical protein OC846_004174 [Tilletia horrida]|uniref:Peptidase metallopeptidase domain-containing protein n=1 Tax=Tilletia horrida TaxID=155126 RepID=A0AAN6JQN2_9BASI|nr:hypothetical protein OC846_004174 [Tilletia horrida]KAK0569614.1 hypothetical protein OC861_000794 [Tilletia horrida]